MARLPRSRKVEQVMTMLLALRNPRITELLRQHGFTAGDLTEGWRFLNALTEGRLRPSARAWTSDLARGIAIEDEMWSWYLAWGAIARGAITDQGLLRELGVDDHARSEVH